MKNGLIISPNFFQLWRAMLIRHNLFSEHCFYCFMYCNNIQSHFHTCFWDHVRNNISCSLIFWMVPKRSKLFGVWLWVGPIQSPGLIYKQLEPPEKQRHFSSFGHSVSAKSGVPKIATQMVATFLSPQEVFCTWVHT
jgi:hypothetical protein